MATEHVLALLIFIGRAGDVLSTHFVTPTMVLETNPIVRRFKWPTFVLGFGLCAAPYYHVPLGVMVAIPSLLVTASNLTRVWMARALGESEMEALFLRAAARGSLTTAIAMVWASAFFFFLAASVLFWLSPDDDIAWYFGLGIALYGLAIAIHSSFFFVRIFRRAREGMGNSG
jgi:hypothetical protein